MYHATAVKEPTIEQIASIAKRLGLEATQEELTAFRDGIVPLCEAFTRLNTLPEPMLPVKYPRVPGYRPNSADNSLNAWYWKTDIIGAASGKLFGKTVAIKDSIPVAGVPMMNGCHMFNSYVPDYDATVVTRILDAGARITGKAVCEDMCYSFASCASANGPVLNPHDKTRNAGGSSSGSAVLIANGDVDLALGADQGGSIRVPAAWCGIVGLKPTYGLVPYTGIMSMEPSLDHVGPMARTVEEVALLLEVLAGYDNGFDGRQPRDLKVPEYSKLVAGKISGLKIGILKEGFQNCQPDVAKIVRDCASKLATTDHGAIVEEVTVPLHTDALNIWLLIGIQGCHQAMIRDSGIPMGMKGLYSSSFVEFFARAKRTRFNECLPKLKLNAITAEYIRDHHDNYFYAKGQNLALTLNQAYDEALKKYDVLVMPTSHVKATELPPKNASVSDIIQNCHPSEIAHNTAPFDVTGHPACSVNAGFSEGLPVGMMIVGNQFDDATVLNVARAVELVRNSTK